MMKRMTQIELNNLFEEIKTKYNDDNEDPTAIAYLDDTLLQEIARSEDFAFEYLSSASKDFYDFHFAEDFMFVHFFLDKFTSKRIANLFIDWCDRCCSNQNSVVISKIKIYCNNFLRNDILDIRLLP